MKYLFTKINNKIKLLATRAQKTGICYKTNDNIRSLVLVPEKYKNDETIVYKTSGKKFYVSATDLVVFFVYKQFRSSGSYISKYYKVVFDGYDFQVSDASKWGKGFYSDNVGIYFSGMESYYIADSGSTKYKTSISLGFSFNGEGALFLNKEIPDLTIPYDYYLDWSLMLEDVAFDSSGYIYINLTLTLHPNTEGTTVTDYRKYICCSKFDDSPFVILRSTYEPSYTYALEENYFSEGAVLKEYHSGSGGSIYLYKTSVYNKGIEVGNTVQNDWRYFGPALNYREDSEGESYRKDSQNVWQRESSKQGNFIPKFFYSPFTDSYYTLEIDRYNIYYYKSKGKTLPPFPSIEGFTVKERIPIISDTSVRTSITSFTTIPSYHRQN